MIAATAANLAPTLAIGHPWPALLQAPRRGRPEPSAAASQNPPDAQQKRAARAPLGQRRLRQDAEPKTSQGS